ncbi:cyclic pyranopterin monophosphate synthase MoaC [bacterium]|nr:cyclic pyranopterin monophosphate synthase MoaC [bacterium]
MSELSHMDERGRARMVDVSGKTAGARSALAQGRVELGKVAFDALRENRASKGDALSVAQVAGILAAKKTGELIPLCHPLPLSHVSVDFELLEDERAVRIEARAACEGATGVEMEALTAVSLAALTIYDMLKALDKGIRITGIELLEKSGGKSGHWKRESE